MLLMQKKKYCEVLSFFQ